MISEFETTLVGSDCAIYGGTKDQDFQLSSSVIINWELKMDFRDWGIKNLFGVFVSLEAEIYDFENDTTKINNFSNWEVEFNFEIVDSCPRYIEFDIDKKHIIII